MLLNVDREELGGGVTDLRNSAMKFEQHIGAMVSPLAWRCKTIRTRLTGATSGV